MAGSGIAFRGGGSLPPVACHKQALGSIVVKEVLTKCTFWRNHKTNDKENETNTQAAYSDLGV